jgi:hypothetical protein
MTLGLCLVDDEFKSSFDCNAMLSIGCTELCDVIAVVFGGALVQMLMMGS